MKRKINISDEVSVDGHTLTDIVVSFETELIQKTDMGGITFQLLLVNTSKEKKQLLNPLDFLKISMTDETGLPVLLPIENPLHRMICDCGEKHDAREYKVERIKNDAQEDSVHASHERKITLEAQGSIEYSILVDKVQNTQIYVPLEQTTETKKLDKGKYSMNIMLLLLISGEINAEATFESGDFEIELQ